MINSGLANKAAASDLTTLQSAFNDIWKPKSLPSGFNSTDRASMSTLKNGVYWHTENDGNLNFPSKYGIIIKFGYEGDGYGDFDALFFTHVTGSIYRCSGNKTTFSGWVKL